MNQFKVGDIVDVDCGSDGRFERYWTGEITHVGLFVIVVLVGGDFEVTAQRQNIRMRKSK